MNFFVTLFLFMLCFAAMAIGLILANKTLKKGCGTTPDDCACQKEGKDPANCDK